MLCENSPRHFCFSILAGFFGTVVERMSEQDPHNSSDFSDDEEFEEDNECKYLLSLINSLFFYPK
jgi:hypothetical protein